MTFHSLFVFLAGILSATGNGYVIFMTVKRKTKLKPPELMTVNLAIFDFGISGTVMVLYAQHPNCIIVFFTNSKLKFKFTWWQSNKSFFGLTIYFIFAATYSFILRPFSALRCLVVSVDSQLHFLFKCQRSCGANKQTVVHRFSLRSQTVHFSGSGCSYLVDLHRAMCVKMVSPSFEICIFCLIF